MVDQEKFKIAETSLGPDDEDMSTTMHADEVMAAMQDNQSQEEEDGADDADDDAFHQ